MRYLKSRSCLLIAMVLLSTPDARARGFGGFHGGGFGGGGFDRGGFGGGGFDRGGFGGGGFGGGGGFNRGGGGFGGLSGGGFDRGGFSGGGFGGFHGGGSYSGSREGSFSGGGFSGSHEGSYSGNHYSGSHEGSFSDGSYSGSREGSYSGANYSGSHESSFNSGGGYYHSPSSNQLNSFLGMPSGSGYHTNDSSAFDVQRGAVEGPRGGYAAGATVTGPNGGEAARGVAVGPNGGVAAGRGVVGPNGAAAGQGIAMGPDGRVAGGSAVRGPYGAAAGRGFVAGPNGVAAGYARVSPASTYTTASAVRGSFNNYGIYGAGWYGAHPGAWAATGWAAGTAWSAATWPALGGWLGYGSSVPTYNYNYGSNIVYQNDNVYVGGQYAGTSAQCYDQASSVANAGTQAVPGNVEWLSLGVFALTPAGQKQSTVTIQLAVDKQGTIRGNYTDNFADQPIPIHGSVDKKSQCVAWTVGENKTDVFEAGLYNLTKAEAPVLVHLGADRTQQWLLVRLKEPSSKSATVVGDAGN
jgi:hypothetical protein